MAVAMVAGLFIAKIEAKDFMTAALMAFTYYFTMAQPGKDTPAQ